MALTGPRKAALLLMSLDPATAAELLKAAGAETIREIAAELAYLNAAGAASSQASLESVREFLRMLSRGAAPGGGRGFLKQLLQQALGAERAEELLGEVQDLMESRDPFLPIRSAAVEDVAAALAGESPQVVALVLSELPTKTSGELLSLLDEGVRGEAIRGMTAAGGAPPDVRHRIATMVRDRLRTEGAAAGGGRRERLRKVAVLLRGLGGELRQGLLAAISEQDPETAETVQGLMITWEDLPFVAGRSLQEALRTADARQLALALSGSPQGVVDVVRQNISERQGEMLDEEASLLSAPKAEDITAARDTILSALREMNESGDLSFRE